MTRMRWNPARLVSTMIALCASIAGCGGGGGGGSADPPTGPPTTVFSALFVAPAEAIMCLVDPGDAVVLIATPRDQSGQVMSGLGNASYRTSNADVATVAANGQVRAIAVGFAQITVSLTAGGTTREASSSITVTSAVTGDASGAVAGNHPLPHLAVLTAAQLTTNNSQTLDIQGQAFHKHTLNLSVTHVRLVAAGCRVSLVSSVDPHSDGSGAHNHTVTFN